MARNGSGVYSLPSQSPAVSGTLITAADRNAIDNDIATALTGSIAADGQTVVTNDISLSTHKLTNVVAGNAATDATNLQQVQNSGMKVLNSVTGADTITATLSPTLTAYATGQEFLLIPASNNTGAVTLNINSAGAKAVTKNGTTALIADDLVANAMYKVAYDGTRFQIVGKVEVLNYIPISGGTFTGAVSVPDDAYDETGWDGSDEVPTKNAVRDKLQNLIELPASESDLTGSTSFDFTVTDTSSKRISLFVDELSLSGTDDILIQVGDSGGVQTSGYKGSTIRVTDTTTDAGQESTGFRIRPTSAGNTISGEIQLKRSNQASNKWYLTYLLGGTDGDRGWFYGGVVTLTNPLTTIRITSSGSDTIDDGLGAIVSE